MLRILGAALGVCCSILIEIEAFAEPKTQSSYDTSLLARLVDGRNLAFYCEGSGSPTVLFESGLAMPAAVWEHVQSAIAAKTMACSFDRAGYGASDPGPSPRDAQHTVDDLHSGLRQLGLHGPFILVGHSMAGYDMQLFANEHPEQVIGMVLVDPSIDGNEAALRKISPTWAREADSDNADNEKCIRGIADSTMKPGSALYIQCGSPDLNSPDSKPSIAKTILSENENQDRSSAEVISSRIKYGSMPIIVLTAGNQFNEDKLPETERQALKAAWLHGHETIASLSTRGQSRVIEGAPHVIHLAKPATVIAAIEEVIRQVH